MNTIDDTKKEKKNGETKEKMKTRRWAAVERWSWVVTMVGLLLTVAALAFGYVQLSEARSALEASTSAALSVRTQEADKIFIEHPELRKYFHGNAAVPGTNQPVLRSQVLATSEYFVDSSTRFLETRVSSRPTRHRGRPI